MQKIAAHAARRGGAQAARARSAQRRQRRQDDPEKEARRQERQRAVRGARRPPARATSTSARRSRRWQPKLDTDAVKLLGSLVLLHHGKAAAWAHRLCVEQPTTTNKQGKVSVRYPRGAQAEKELHGEATRRARCARGRPRTRSRSSCACSSHSGSSTPTGCPNADRQGVYEPQELAASKVLDKLARRVAPPSVKQHLAEQEAERERREQAWRDEQAARLAEQRAKLAAGEPVRCACCFEPIDVGRRRRREARQRSSTPATASSSGAAPTTKRRHDEEAATDASSSARPTNLDSTRDTDASRPINGSRC